MIVHPLQIRSFPAKSGTVIDKFAVNFPRGKINKRHEFPQKWGNRLLIAYALMQANALRRKCFATDNDWGDEIPPNYGASDPFAKPFVSLRLQANGLNWGLFCSHTAVHFCFHARAF